MKNFQTLLQLFILAKN